MDILGFLLAVALIVFILWGLPRMIRTNNKIAAGEPTFFDKIAAAIFGPKR